MGLADTASAQQINKHGKSHPKVTISKVAKGDEITTALGANAAAVAEWYGMSAADLGKVAKREKSLRTDKDGFLHNVCEAIPAVDPGQGGNQTGVTAPFPEAQTFLLHSKPGSSKVIYLDFNGHTTSGTQWNLSYTGGADIVTPPYDIDSNPSSFSSQELANIQVIWQRMAEDFAPFDVDVTTEDPGVEALRKTSPSDVNFGKRVCIGGSSFDWLAQSAGGIAYLSSFDWNVDTPVFVFPAQLGSGYPRYVAEAAAHETGHTFGLHHDGTTLGVEYYQGNADWAPIMGVGYYSNIVQWSRGEYTNANNIEDDLAIISSYIPFRGDTVGNNMGTATALPAGTTPSVNGLIENSTDVDVYSFTTAAGSITLNLAPASPSGNLFGQVTLYDVNGTPLATAVPATTSAGTVALNATVAAGNYFVSVDGAGFGNPATSGFSDYDSIGQFTLSATLVSNVQPPPNTAPVANAQSSTPLVGTGSVTVGFSSSGSYDPDGFISSYSWNFGDGTALSTASSPSHTYNAPGTYTATLTVTDNGGLSSSNSVTVIVNVAPVANAKNSTPLKGAAPLAVNFSSTGSSDPDGSISDYSWTFGDGMSVSGGALSSACNPAHTYSTAGDYTSQLTVTDNRGAKSSDSVTIHVAAANAVDVYDITMSTTFASGKYTAKANVTVKDVAGNLKPGATVKGNWSGVVSATGATATTGTNGVATFTSASTATLGSFTFTVTGITLTNFVYDAAMNTVTAASITPPPNVLSVAGIAMSTTFASSKYTAKATVTVVNPYNGSPISGATVTGKWSGAVSATGVTAITDATGKAVLTSASTATAGTFTFTVTGITLSGYTYDATKNVVSSASITPPPNVLSVSAITMTTALARGKYTAKANVTVVNPYNGAVVSGAAVKGNWSGVVSATGATATTGTTGIATLTSASTATKGTFTFTVTGITLTAYTYDATKNTITAASITPP